MIVAISPVFSIVHAARSRAASFTILIRRMESEQNYLMSLGSD